MMKTIIRWLLPLLIVLGLSACREKPFNSPPTPIPGALLVDTTQSLGKISPYVYGANHGPWAFVKPEFLDKIETAGIAYLRFPGGAWGDDNTLRASHIDDFITLCRQIGAEPQISVRLIGGTPEKAAELVRYANLEKGYGVRFWSIGNEPENYHARTGFEDYDSGKFSQEWREFAEAMRAIDPNITLIGPEIAQYTGTLTSTQTEPVGLDWMRSFLELNGDLVDVVSIHRYPFPLGRTTGIASRDDLIASTQEWEQILSPLRTLIMETTGRTIPIAITEVNSYGTNAIGGETTPDSFYSALWWADVLGIFIENKVEIAAYFALQSKPSTGGFGLVSRQDVRPSFYVYKLYQRFGTELVQSSSEDPNISIYAALQEDQTLTILVINRGDSAVQKTIQTLSEGLSEQATVWLFDANNDAEQITSMPWKEQTEVNLPPYSASLFVIPSLTQP